MNFSQLWCWGLSLPYQQYGSHVKNSTINCWFCKCTETTRKGNICAVQFKWDSGRSHRSLVGENCQTTTQTAVDERPSTRSGNKFKEMTPQHRRYLVLISWAKELKDVNLSFMQLPGAGNKTLAILLLLTSLSADPAGLLKDTPPSNSCLLPKAHAKFT